MKHYQEFIALGSKTGMTLVSDGSPAQIDKLYRKLWKEIFLFERRFSRFLPGSELSMFNRNAGTKQPISQEFYEILKVSRKMAHDTNGLYNPFILPALQNAGYTHSRVPGHEHDMVDNHSNKSVVDIGKLEIGEYWARIPYGTAIDLGGCGKGYLADLLRDKLPSSITGYWLSFGGDIVISGHDEDKQRWAISIESAGNINEDIGIIEATKPCGVATSGTTVHKGKGTDNRAWHHIIDPRTLQPAETDTLLATVCDESSLRADVLASCAVILGSKLSLPFLKKQGVQSAVLQYRTDKGDYIKHFGKNIKLGVGYA